VLRLAGIVLYLAGLVFAEALRLPRRISRARSGAEWRRPAGGSRLPELLVVIAVLVGIWVLPLAYAFTRWLQPFDYSVPAWAVGAAALIFVFSLFIRWQGQRALGTRWSPTLETATGHEIVDHGIYAYIRHPIYVALLLWAAAQPFLLQNVLAGWGGAVAAALIWIVRVPREERMMLERFGDQYRQYMARTARAIPRLRRTDGPV
jgi:protein-S-isoprenylcysteine O-methyltransferase Ste14